MASIVGFCWPLSAAPGESINFYVSVAGNYTVSFVRFANNDPATVTAADICNSQEMSEHFLTDIVLNLSGSIQPDHKPNEPCLDWDVAFTRIIPPDWISGIYAAKCANATSIFYINFVVKPDPAKRNPLLVLANVNTWNAYNGWGGYSRYDNRGEDFTYCRPNPTMNLSIRDDLEGVDSTDPLIKQVPAASRHLTRAELWVLNWMQEHGFAYDVYSDLDWHYGIDAADDYESLVLNTHPEYWTLEMYNALKQFLDNGGNLIYLGGNAIYEHVEVSPDGLTMHCFGIHFHQGNLFREMGLSEDSLLGLRYVSTLDLSVGGPYTVRNKNRFCTGNIFVGKVIGTRGWNIPPNGTKLEQGAASGWETDRTNSPTGPLVEVLADDHNAYPNRGQGAQMIYYERPAGNFVLSAGSIRFGGSLILDGDLQTIVSNAMADRTRVLVDQNLHIGATSGVALAVHDGRLFIAWRDDNNQLRMGFSNDGINFDATFVSTETSDVAPALASHNGRLFIAWKGMGDGYLNVAKVSLFASSAGAFGIDAIEENVTLSDSTSDAPALASHDGRLFVAWKGSDNENLNVMFSDDNGTTFHGKNVSAETSNAGPSLASHNGELFISWKGTGAGYLNVARVGLIANTAGSFTIAGIVDNVTLSSFSDYAPAIASLSGLLFLVWAARAGDYRINIVSSADGKTFSSTWTDNHSASGVAPAIAVLKRMHIAWVSMDSSNEIHVATLRI